MINIPHTYREMTISSAQMEVPRESYQRNFNVNRAKKIAEEFDEREKIMLRKEYKSCLHMLSKAQKKAVKTYYRVNQGADENLINNSCMFSVLEQAYISYLDKMEKK